MDASLSMMNGSTMDITLAHIETLQTSLMSERQDRLNHLNKIGDLESMISMLRTQFKHTSIERDVERAKTNLFSDVHSDVRSPSLVVRTVLTLLDYPGVYLGCFLKVNDQWVVISATSDDHIFVSSIHMDDVMGAIDVEELILEKITSLPSVIVNALNLAYDRRFDSYNVHDNMIFTAINRECSWVIVSDSSLRNLLDNLNGWTALLGTASRLIMDAYKRQQEDIERNELSLVRSIFDNIFETLFVSFDPTSSNDHLRQQLQHITSILNSMFPACSSELFILDSNNISINSSFEYLNLANFSESSVLLTAILQKRSAVCCDPFNKHRDIQLDCGNVSSSIAMIIVLPLWISKESSGYLMFRFFDNYNQERCIQLATSLTETIGPMLHFWAKQNLVGILKDIDLSDGSSHVGPTSPSLDHPTFIRLVTSGMSALLDQQFSHTLSAFLHCSWTLFIEARRDKEGSYVFCLYNDNCEKRGLSLLEARDELKGFLCSIFGLDDSSLLAYENSTLARRKGLIHLLNGLDSKASGLQGFLRCNLKAITNLVGFRVAHPDIETQNNEFGSDVFLAVVSGRGWGVFESPDITPRAVSLCAVFDFAAEHRSLVRLLDVSQKLDAHVQQMEADVCDKRAYDALLHGLRTELGNLAGQSPNAYRQALVKTLEGLAERVGLLLSLLLHEDVHGCVWSLGSTGTWSRLIAPTASSSAIDNIAILQTDALADFNGTKTAVLEKTFCCGVKSVFFMSARMADGSQPTGEVTSSIILSIAGIVSAGTGKNTQALFGSDGGEVDLKRMHFNPDDFPHVIREEIRDQVTPALHGSSLLQSLVDAHSPLFNVFPVYLSNDAVTNLLDSTPLSLSLSQAVRGAYVQNKFSSTTSSSFNLLGNADIYLEYFSTKSMSKESMVAADRAYMYSHRSICNLVADNDCLIFIVLCSGVCVPHPIFFGALDEMLYKHILPIQLLNQIGSVVVLKHAFSELTESHRAAVDFIEVSKSICAFTDKGDTGMILDQLTARLTFNTQLLDELSETLASQDALCVLTSAVEKVASRLGASTGVSITWANQLSSTFCSTKDIYSEEMLRLVVASNKPLLIESAIVVEKSSPTDANISYVPVSSEAGVLAVIQYTYSTDDDGNHVFRQSVEDCVRSLGKLLHRTRGTRSDSLLSVSHLISIEKELPLDREFLYETRDRISFLLSSFLKASVCVLRESAVPEAYGRSKALLEEGTYLSGTVYRWRPTGSIADSGNTYINLLNMPDETGLSCLVLSSLFHLKDCAVKQVYMLVCKVGDYTVVIESSDRIPPSSVFYVETFAAMITSMSERHALRKQNVLQEHRLDFESCCRLIQSAKTEDELQALVRGRLRVVLQCRDASLLKVDRPLIVSIDETRRRKEASLFSEAEMLRPTDESLAALSLSTDTMLPLKKGTLESELPCLIVPVIILEHHPSFALKLSFDTLASMNTFMAQARDEELPSVVRPGITDALIFVDSLSSWIHKTVHLKQSADVTICSSATLELSTSFSKLFHTARSQTADCTPDLTMLKATPSKISPSKTSMSFLSPVKDKKLYHHENPFEDLAVAIAEHNRGLNADDIVCEFRLHWRSLPDTSSWVTHSELLKRGTNFYGRNSISPGNDESDWDISVKTSTDQDLLFSIVRREILSLAANDGHVVYLSLGTDAVLEIRLRRPLFPRSYAVTDLHHRETSSLESESVKTAWKALMSIQQSATYLVSAAGSAQKLDNFVKKSIITIESDATLLGILSDCIHDIYDHSTGDAQGNRIEACIQTTHFHLSRLPNVLNVDVDYKSPTGEVLSMISPKLGTYETPLGSRRLYSMTGTLKTNSDTEISQSKEYTFECHDIRGIISIKCSSVEPDELERDQAFDVVVRTLAKVLGRRVYELEKSVRNRLTLKGKVEEISKKKKEIVLVDEQRATLQSALEENELEKRSLGDRLKSVQTLYDEATRQYEESIKLSTEAVQDSKRTLEAKQMLFEAELTKQQEKIQRYKADRKVYDESRVETTCLVQSLQQTISSQEQDYLRRETEWRLLNEDAHKASTIINDLRLQLQLQGAVALQHDEDRRNLTAENERLTTQLSSLKQRGAALDTSSTALEREIVELKADRERAIQKIIKRDSKLKDAAVMMENLQKSFESGREEHSLLTMKLQMENRELSARLEETRVRSSDVKSAEEGHAHDLLSASRSSIEVLQKPLILAESELGELRIKYNEAIHSKIPKLQTDLDESLQRVQELSKASTSLAVTLTQRDEEIEVWRRKFEIQERERDALVEGWKDILSTAGGSPLSSTSGKSVKKLSGSSKAIWK